MIKIIINIYNKTIIIKKKIQILKIINNKDKIK